jgi:predicted HicB family RNase H-like nuclease
VKQIIIKNFSDELHREAKIQAAKQGVTMKALIEQALREYPDRCESKEHKKGR